MMPFELFDAVEITHFPEGQAQIPAYYSATGVSHIKVGDVGVVLAEWPGNKLRVEAVDASGRIVWQDHFAPQQLKRLESTAAAYPRRRINEHWAWQLGLGEELRQPNEYQAALSFARKVMKFAARNVEMLIERLVKSGYRFARRSHFKTPPRADALQCFSELAARGIFVPIALQAWCLEVGGVDLCGTHPAWQRSAYSGMGEESSESDPLYTDPLVVSFEPDDWLQASRDSGLDESGKLLDIAPDIIHKANVSGAAPVSVSGARPAFDPVLIGQAGSFTLLSYLRWAFDWGGFPGFENIPDAPRVLLTEWSQGLTRL